MGSRPLAILALLSLVFSAAIHAELAGSASVTDGDTLTVAGQRIRLFGIDAPESKQVCVAGGQRWRYGRFAARALREHIAGRPVVCTEPDRDRSARVVLCLPTAPPCVCLFASSLPDDRMPTISRKPRGPSLATSWQDLWRSRCRIYARCSTG